MLENLLKTLVEATRETQMIILIALGIIAIYAFISFLKGRTKVDQTEAESNKITVQLLEKVEMIRAQSDQDTAKRFSEVLTQMASVITQQLGIQQAFTGEVKNIRSTIDNVGVVLSGSNAVTTENTRSLQGLTQAVQNMMDDANRSRERVRTEMFDRSQTQIDMLTNMPHQIEQILSKTLLSLLEGLADIRKNISEIITVLQGLYDSNNTITLSHTNAMEKLTVQLAAVDNSIKAVDLSVKAINEDYRAMQKVIKESIPSVPPKKVTGTLPALPDPVFISGDTIKTEEKKP